MEKASPDIDRTQLGIVDSVAAYSKSGTSLSLK